MSLPKLFAVLAVAGVASLGVGACDDDDGGGTDASAEASVSFTSPEDGATTGDPVTVEVALENFTLDAANVGQANEAGSGHLHFSMDGGEYDFPKYSGANGELAEMLGVEGQYSPATEPTITYEGLPPGEHTLEVDLVNNDHSETGASTTVDFTVE